MCNCIQMVDEKLAERGATRIHNPLTISDSGKMGLLNRVQIETYLADSKKRGEKKLSLTASFCPFCGADYKKEAPTS